MPTFYAAFLADPAAPRTERRSRAPLRFGRRGAAAGCRPALVAERYGVDILDGIGSTEMLHIFVSNRAGEVKYGTTGKPVPGYDVRLVDDDGSVVQTRGEMGELQVRGPTSAVMYWNNREQSRATFLGEWTRSGDKYLEDDDGYLVYCGRRDDMLKVGGIYVSPFEVEGALQRPSRCPRSRGGGLARRRRADQAQGIRGAQITGKSRRRPQAGASGLLPARSSPPTNIRAGSSSAPNCRKQRPARFQRFRLRAEAASQ